MKHFFQKATNIFLYGCDGPADFAMAADKRRRFNHRVWRVTTFGTLLYFSVMFLTTFWLPAVENFTMVFAVMSWIALGFCALFAIAVKTESPTLMGAVYGYTAVLLIWALYMGTSADPGRLAVSFNVLLVALPLFVADRPWRMSTIEALATVAFCLVAAAIKEDGVRQRDIYNAVCFGILGQIVNFYLAESKMHQFLMARKAEVAEVTDELTGIRNRKAYEKDLRGWIADRPRERMVYVVVDLNGLKYVNDNLGHSAGDELIRGTADCLRRAVGELGRAYRIGGDEFVAVVEADDEHLGAIHEAFCRSVDEWTGEQVTSLSVALGVAPAREFPDLSVADIAKTAENRMYKSKSRYYSQNGIDRRRR